MAEPLNDEELEMLLSLGKSVEANDPVAHVGEADRDLIERSVFTIRELRAALEHAGEVLEHTGESLGLPGRGDSKDRKADAEDVWGVGSALNEIGTALASAEPKADSGKLERGIIYPPDAILGPLPRDPANDDTFWWCRCGCCSFNTFTRENCYACKTGKRPSLPAAADPAGRPNVWTCRKCGWENHLIAMLYEQGVEDGKAAACSPEPERKGDSVGQPNPA